MKKNEIENIEFNSDMSRRQFTENLIKFFAVTPLLSPLTANAGVSTTYNPHELTEEQLKNTFNAKEKLIINKLYNAFIPPEFEVRKKLQRTGFDITQRLSEYLVPQGEAAVQQAKTILSILNVYSKVSGVVSRDTPAKKLVDLTDKQAYAFLDRMKNTPDDRLFKGVHHSLFRSAKMIATQPFYSEEEVVWKEINYNGPWLKDMNDVNSDVPESTSFPLAREMNDNINLLRKNVYTGAEEVKILLHKMKLSEKSYDVVIVGSGAGGSVAAMNLAKEGRNILVIEKGDFIEPKQFLQRERTSVPKFYDVEFSSSMKVPVTGDPVPDMKASVVRGRLVGGSATINHAITLRAPKPVLSEWRSDHGFSINLDGSFREIEKLLHIAPVPNYQLSGNNRLQMEAMNKLGKDDDHFSHHGISGRNVKDCRGCGFCEMGCRYNRKQTPLNVILPNACKKAGERGRVDIIANAEVNELIFSSRDKKKVERISINLMGKTREIVGTADITAKKVILAAGTMDSPRILLRSGVDNKNIGKHFTCHASQTVFAEFAEPFYPASGGPPMSYFGEFFDKPNANSDRDKISYALEGIFNAPVVHSQMMPFESPEKHFNLMKNFNNTMTMVLLFKDNRVSKKEGDDEENRIEQKSFSYQLKSSDRKRYAGALRSASKIMFAAGAKRVIFNTIDPLIIESESEIDDKLPDSIVDDPTRFLLMSGHPQGGNAMGKSASNSVVEADSGKVWGTENLYVMDGSILPTSVGVNPSLTIYALSNVFSKKIDRELS